MTETGTTLGTFGGREHERELLSRALRDHRETGRGAFVLIGAKPGMGKTALVDCFVAESGTVDVLRLRCTGDAFPFAPLVWLERELEPIGGRAHAPGDPVSAGSGRGRPRFASALIARQIEDVRRVGRRAIDSETLRRRAAALYQGFVELLARVPTTIDRPSRIVVLDDLHLADDDTLHVLQCLAEPPYPLEALLVGNYRLGATSPTLERLVHSVQALSGSDSRYAHVRLRPLDVGEVSEIVQARIPEGRFSREAVIELTERCGGSPDLLDRALVRMVDEGWLKPTKRGGTVLELPDDLGLDNANAAALRAARIPEELRATLRRAAVLGSRFSSTLLARLEDREEIEVLESFQRAHDAGGCPVEMQGDAWTFQDPDLVPVLRAELLAPLRAAYAAKAARILRGAQKRAPDSGLPRIYPGRIAALCELAEDPVGALAAHVEAAGNDETLLALSSARGHLERARQLVGRGISLPGTDANLGWHLAADHGRVLLAITADRQPSASPPDTSTTEVQQGLVLLNDALSEADAADADVRDRATLRATLAAALMRDVASRHEALTQIRRARTLLVVGGFPAQSWHYAGTEADILVALGDVASALKTCQAALKYFRKEGADLPLAKADLAATLLRVPRLRRAQLVPTGSSEHESQRKALETALDEAAELYRGNGDNAGLAGVHLERTRLLLQLGRENPPESEARDRLLSEARSAAESLQAVLESVSGEAELAESHQTLAEVHAALGAIEKATDHLRRAGLHRLTDGAREMSDIFRALDDIGGAAASRIRTELGAAGALG